MSTIQFLDITVDIANSERDALKLLRHIRPHWNEEDIEVKVFSEGYMNHMLRVNIKADEDKKHALVIRSFGVFFIDGEQISLEKDPQVMAMQIAHKVEIAEPIEAIFKNGIVYWYAPGRTLTAEDAKNPDIIRKICQTAARYHLADWESIKAYNMAGDLANIEMVENKFENKEKSMEFLRKGLPEKARTPENDEIMKSVFPPRDELLELYVKGRERLDELIPKVFSHNDIHIKNMVYNPENEKITLLDYEMVGLNYIGKDISRIMATATVWKEIDENVEFYDEDIMLYAKMYTEELNKHQGRNLTDIDKEVDLLFWRIKMCIAFSYLMASMDFLCREKIKVENSTGKQINMGIKESVKFFKLYKEMEDFFCNSIPPELATST